MIDYLILYRNPGYIQDISVLFLAFAEAHGMSLLSLLLLFKQKGQRIEKENNANQFTKRELGPRLYCQVQNPMLLFTGEILAGFQHLLCSIPGWSISRMRSMQSDLMELTGVLWTPFLMVVE